MHASLAKRVPLSALTSHATESDKNSFQALALIVKSKTVRLFNASQAAAQVIDIDMIPFSKTKTITRMITTANPGRVARVTQRMEGKTCVSRARTRDAAQFRVARRSLRLAFCVEGLSLRYQNEPADKQSDGPTS